MRWRCAGFEFNLEQPVLMGIVNVTPDSFSDGGEHSSPDTACAFARQLVAEGAGIIDVGGESTRPGAGELAAPEELRRVLPVVRQLAAEGLCVSIDSRHPPVVEACLEAGAAIINDVSGFREPAMCQLAAGSDAGVVIMHMQGEPGSMQQNPQYGDVVREVAAYLLEKASMLVDIGVAAERICIDPGPGFGKTFEHNRQLLRGTRVLANLGYPLMAAWSRKGFIGQLSGVEQPAQRMAGSAAAAVYAASQGARILRVHDVAPTAQALRILQAVM
ncbi:MAG: dihydropteroate synthase [Coriobacteriales bacterium]|jgi:dihydropteroate synthase|nr:dihydropteroate synthase [Coriobacteriales bacterium]